MLRRSLGVGCVLLAASCHGGGAGVPCGTVSLPASLVDGGEWDPAFTLPGLTGQDGYNPGVYDLALAGDELLAVGYFRWAGAAPVPPVVARAEVGWSADGRVDTLEHPVVSAIAADEFGRVAIATYTSSAIPLEERTGEILVSEGGGPYTVVGRFHGGVRALAWFADELWVGGVYTLDDPAIDGLARWTGAAWVDGEVDGLGVYELTLDGDGLLIGGSFTAVGGAPAENVARWDGAVHAIDLPDAVVYALARDGSGGLVAGGLMSVEGSYETGGIAAWDGASWTSLAGGLANSTFRGVVSDLALHDGALFVGGCFRRAGDVPASGMARWDGAWTAVDDGSAFVTSAWFSPLACGDEGPAAIWDAQIQRLLSTGDRLYVGGFFPGLGGVPSPSVVSWAGGAWSAEGPAGDGLSGAARALAVGGEACDLYALGGISHAGATPVGNAVVQREGDQWTIATPPVPDGYCAALAVDDRGQIAVGCDGEAPATGFPVGQVWALIGDQWLLQGESPAGGVAALGYDARGDLWAVGGGLTGYALRVRGGLAVALGTFDGRVAALALADDGTVVVGGTFTEVDGVPARGVARWDGAWEALGDGLAGTVLAVAVADDGTVYASAADDGTADRLVLGRWDGAAWTELAPPTAGPLEAGYSFSSLLARDGKVVASGYGWPASGERNVFVWDGETFRGLRGGVAAISVDASALAADGLWFAGAIAEAGAPDARVPSVGIAHLR